MIEIERVTDIESLLAWRAEVISKVFGQKPDKRLLAANRQYYERHIQDGTHLAFVATVEGEDAGCGAICITEELPSPDNPSGLCAYLMNIYVREAFRNQGAAHAIVSRLIEESKRIGCDKIYLETTAEGKPVYTSLGFSDMPDMMKYYDTEIRY